MLIYEMPKRKQDKSLTKEELGGMLHKYINPLYEKMDKLERNQNQLKDDVDEVKKIQLRMKSRDLSYSTQLSKK